MMIVETESANTNIYLGEGGIMPREKDVLTTGEVAKICNVAPRTVSKWFDSGQLRGYRIPGSKDRRIPINSLIRFMKSHSIPLDGLMSGQARVLIIDNEDEVVNAVKQLLSEHTDYETHVATSGFIAGLECERFRPNVILLDVHLDSQDSRELCKAIRQIDDLQMTKIIGMSGKLTDGQIHQLKINGLDGFIKKPFNIKQVIQVVEDAMSIVY